MLDIAILGMVIVAIVTATSSEVLVLVCVFAFVSILCSYVCLWGWAVSFPSWLQAVMSSSAGDVDTLLWSTHVCFKAACSFIQAFNI